MVLAFHFFFLSAQPQFWWVFDFRSASESPAFGTGGAHSPLEMQLAASDEANRSEPAIRLYIPHPLPTTEALLGRGSGGARGNRREEYVGYRCTCTFLVFILVLSFFVFVLFSFFSLFFGANVERESVLKTKIIHLGFHFEELRFL